MTRIKTTSTNSNKNDLIEDDVESSQLLVRRKESDDGGGMTKRDDTTNDHNGISSTICDNNCSSSCNETTASAPTTTKTKISYCHGDPLPTDAPEWAKAASSRIQARLLKDAKNKQSEETKTLTDHDDDDNNKNKEIGGEEHCSNETSANSNSTIRPPPGTKRVLLHSCCAPCSGAMVEEMCSQKSLEEVAVFFYNPNIHPRKEYLIRKEENKKFCEKLGIPFVDMDYDVENWYARTKGMEFDPERGRRCTECFDMRMERTALYAYENGYDTIATTNATSRWKDAQQVDASGYQAAARYPNMIYWTQNWQSDTMTLRKYQISAEQRFYKQEYCGCSYSLRDSNDWRKANGIPKIQIGGETAGLGERYFTDPLKDAEEEAQHVVDEFFAQANELAEQAGRNISERKRVLAVYKDRRKNEANDGTIHGLNNW